MIKLNFDPTAPYKYVRYGRMSSDEQNPRSPDQQFQTIASTITKTGHPWVHLRDYRDDAISGRYVKRRPGLTAMRQEIQTRQVEPDLVLVDTSERFGRAEELAEIRRQLRVRYGVLILTADSRFADPTTPAGRVMETFENLRSVEENRIKAHQVRRGKVDAIMQNHWPGGPPPFGYKLQSVLVERHGRQEVDHCVLVPNPETDWIIVKLFRRAQKTGHGQLRLARFLNDDLEIPQKHKPFLDSTVGRWIGDPIYGTGTLVWGENAGDIVEDVRILRPVPEADVIVKADFCEPLIDPETDASVQRLRLIRSHRARMARDKKSQRDGKLIKALVPGVALVYPLSGLVVCEQCGRSMVVSSGTAYTMKSGIEKRYPSYFCPGGLAGACTNKRRISEPWLLREVLQRINGRFLSPLFKGGE
jgi:site-specific DNA recombinase